MSIRIPTNCRGCGKPLLIENILVDDGCPCNTPRGINLVPKPCPMCRTQDCVKPQHHIIVYHDLEISEPK